MHETFSFFYGGGAAPTKMCRNQLGVS